MPAPKSMLNLEWMLARVKESRANRQVQRQAFRAAKVTKVAKAPKAKPALDLSKLSPQQAAKLLEEMKGIANA